MPRNELLHHVTAVRKDPAVHVSLSSDSLFKQPGDRRKSPPPVARRVVEAHASENHRIPFHCSSEELQWRVIAPTTSGWRADGRYIGFGFMPCQPQIDGLFSVATIKIGLRHRHFRDFDKTSVNSFCAALRPYSWAVLGS